MRRLRLRFWLFALDVVHALRLHRLVYDWILCRASNATEWVDSTELNTHESGDEPW